MRRRASLVIFLRAPLRGTVKRRLAAAIGAAAAHRFYVETSRALIRRLGGDRRWRLALAVTPDRYARGARFWPRAARPRAVIPQGRGDLGGRMARVFERLPPGPVVLIGADIPGVEAGHVAAAFARLGRFEAVFGPAADGGYWLVGLARRRLGRRFARSLFAGVRWSSRHALADTRANLPEGAEAPALATIEDIDDPAAYERLRIKRSGNR